MNTRLTLAIATLCLCAPLGHRAAAQPPDQPPAHQPPDTADFDQKLEAIDARFSQVQTLRGRFTQSKHTPLLKKPLVSSGKIMIKGDRTRWDTSDPRRSVMTMGADGLRIYFPEQRVVEIYDLGDDVREFSGSPLPQLAKLRASFDLAPLSPSGMGAPDDDASLLALELLPRTDALKEHISFIRVLIDSSIPAVRRIQFEDIDGELTVVEFSDIELNITIDDRDLSLDVPRGTREVHPLNPHADAPGDSDK